MIRLSVVIPTYQRKDLLLRCLKRLKAQHFPAGEFEIIVVADGCLQEGEATRAFLQAALPHDRSPVIRVLHCVRQCGPATARNIGWKNAGGELIVFTDDDCIPSAGFLEAYWEAYIRLSRAMVAFTGPVTVPIPSIPTDYERSIARMQWASLLTANFCCPRALLEAVGGFDEAFSMAWREDSDLEFRLLENRIPIYRIEEAEVQHPVRKARWGMSLFLEKKNESDALLYRKHPTLFRNHIRRFPVWRYYGVFFCSLALLVCVLVRQWLPALLVLGCWLLLVLSFAVSRLRHTRKSFSHVSEMIITSMLLPYLSLFWLWKGAWKYKVFIL